MRKSLASFFQNASLAGLIACVLSSGAQASVAMTDMSFVLGKDNTSVPAAPTGTNDLFQPASALISQAEAATPAKPSIESAKLDDIDPDATGLLTQAAGGLGSALWNGTPRAVVDRLLTDLALPTPSPTLNRLARRLLLTTAQVPAGKSASSKNLSDMRIEQLLSLGLSDDAWQMARLVKDQRLGKDTQRKAVEALLLKGDIKTACEKLPSFVGDKPSPDWQKLLIVCQLQSNDMNAAQLSADLLREQVDKDDIFISIVTKNIQEAAKQLPPRVTPLTMPTLALLHYVNLPLPPEVFSSVDSTYIQTLLASPASDENAKLAFADKAAARGLISSSDLATLYKSVTRDPAAKESAVRTRAYTYQDMLLQQDPNARLDLAEKYLQTLSGPGLSGSAMLLLAETIRDIPAQEPFRKRALLLAQIFAFAGHADWAGPWAKMVFADAPKSSEVAIKLQPVWPVLALSGLVPDANFSRQFATWLDAMLIDNDAAQRQMAGNVMLLLAAAGNALPEEAWGRVAASSSDKKGTIPPALWIERLKDASVSGHKGEAVLLSLLIAGKDLTDVPLFAMVDIVRALRLSDMSAEAQGVARETLAALMAPLAP